MRIISGKHRGAKLYTLEGLDTRPTLDRVKEPLFSILNFELAGAVILDLFAGSGALGLEAISRGAKKAVLCDNAREAIHIIQQNVQKLKEEANVQIIKNDYLEALQKLSQEQQKFDIVFLDPPYQTDFAVKACKEMISYDLLKKESIIVIETDKKEELIDKMIKLDLYKIYDERKYGRAELLFLKQK